MFWLRGAGGFRSALKWFYIVNMSVVTNNFPYPPQAGATSDSERRGRLRPLQAKASLIPQNSLTENLIFFLIISLLTKGQECLAGNFRLACR